MVKKIFLSSVMLITLFSFAQQNKFIEGRLIKANLSYAQSFMLQHSNQNVYLNGYVEYFSSPIISLRGDAFWYIDSRQNNPIIKQNYLIQFGAILHKQLSINDFYIGFQPGFSYTMPNSIEHEQYYTPLRLLPTLNILGGYTLYFSKYCHFNIGINYVISRYRGVKNGSMKLDELMISGGLGFHLKPN